MKMQTLVRMQMLMGLGAALLLASSASAQQTMNPAGSYSAAAAQQAEKTALVPVIESDGSENMVEMALGGGEATQQETELARVMIADLVMLAILMAGIAAIAMYAMAASRRNRTLDPILHDRLQQVSFGPATGATIR